MNAGSLSGKLIDRLDLESVRLTYWYRLRVMMLSVIIIYSFSLVTSCSEQQSHTAPAVRDRDSVSMMVSYGVNTLISDSGVIKYRIVTERWEVNTIKNPSRWIFEKGIFMEQYDKTFHIEGYIQADSAWYYDQQKLWELRGRVSIRNVNGLYFTSEELYWDGVRQEFYSYKFSRLITPDRTLEGTYFRSDEQMNHYEVSNSVGSFQSEDMENGNSADQQQTTDVQQTPADAQELATPLRPAATKKRASTSKSTN